MELIWVTFEIRVTENRAEIAGTNVPQPLKYCDRDLHKVLVVSPLILLSHDQIGSQNFVPEDPKCTQERPKQFLEAQ